MSDEVVIITPELPGAGGLGDYTQRLIEAWPVESKPRLLVANETIAHQLPAHGGKILVQYSAYGFDRHGYPRQLIRALIDWKKKTRGLLVVMFHEIWTFWPAWNRNRLVQFFHRRAMQKLIGYADAVVTTTSSQAEHLGKLLPAKPVRVLPVGSNIPRNEDVDLARQRGWAVLFGLEAGRVRALKQMHSALHSLAARGLVTKIITVGAGDGRWSQEEASLLSSLKLKEGFEQRARVDENEISKLLSTACYGISAQDELSLGKSGSFMAYAAHGLNILSSAADSTKSEPISLLISPNELLAGVSDAELKNRAERLLAWQRQTSSWDLIAAAFADVLKIGR